LRRRADLYGRGGKHWLRRDWTQDEQDGQVPGGGQVQNRNPTLRPVRRAGDV